MAKSLGEGYAGYRFGFGNSKAPRSSRHASGHKASFKDPGPAFVNVSMPFTSFSNYWNAATGELSCFWTKAELRSRTSVTSWAIASRSACSAMLAWFKESMVTT